MSSEILVFLRYFPVLGYVGHDVPMSVRITSAGEAPGLSTFEVVMGDQSTAAYPHVGAPHSSVQTASSSRDTRERGTAITPLAFLETVMVRGYQSLVDEDTTVSYRDGMEAALKLNEISRKDEGAMDRARTLADMGRIIEVVRTFIPSERWPDVQAALRGETPASQQTSHAVDGVRMVPIDDTPDENDD